jgi:hypothetical protein
MPWVRFTEDFDFSPAARKGHVTIAYKAGMVQNVTRECANKAAARKKAVATKAPRKADENSRR